jgi:hypothetical protein
MIWQQRFQSLPFYFVSLSLSRVPHISKWPLASTQGAGANSER